MGYPKSNTILKICRTFAIVFLHICLIFPVCAQLNLSGRVTDEHSRPINGVTVDGDGVKQTKTNERGFFSLVLPLGTYRVCFNHVAFVSSTHVLQTTDGIHQIVLQSRQKAIEEVQVYGRESMLTSTFQQLKEEHQYIAGGTSLTVLHPESARLETMKDALKYEPGVVIQEAFGANDQPRLSIRGSGIQSNPQRRGIYLLQDGIPVNFADGSFIIGMMDPAVASSVEVFKGANALKYGAATLGGAINFNSYVGRHRSGIQVKAEAGSYGHGSLAALLGQDWQGKDMFVSISASRQDGFRLHNQNRKIGLTSNFGYKISDRVDNRIYLSYATINFDVPGPLTLDMIEEDPTRVSKGVNLPYSIGPNIQRDNPGREASVLRVANKTAYRWNKTTDVTFSLYYQYIRDRFVFPIVLSNQLSRGHDLGGSVELNHRFDRHVLSAGVLANYGEIDRRGHINKDGLDSYMFSHDRLTAPNITGYVQQHYHMTDRWHLIGNLQAVYNQRNSQDIFPNPDLRPWYSHSSHQYRYFHSENISLNQHYIAFNPRIGTIYNAGKNKDIQFFGNVSKSHEPPTFDELVGSAVSSNINTSPKQLFTVRLNKQSAYTAEVGSRYEHAKYAWNISLYHSWLRDELLEVKDFVLGVKQTKNYPNTVHRGAEIGAMWIPVEGIWSARNKDKVIWRGMYTYSDFYFSSGAYRGNKLSGVPPHYLASSVEYQYPKFLFVAVNLESQPARSPIDHTNTMYQPHYTIFGVRVGTDVWEDWSVYLEAKNIANRRYAASYIINDQIHPPAIPFPNFGVDNVAFFMPGQLRSIYVGLSYKIKK